MNIGELGQEGPTLHKHCARLRIQQIEMYCKDTKIPGMSSVVQLTQSVTGECNNMTKQKLKDDLFLNELESNAELWKVNYERVKQTRSKWIVANKENSSLIKAMFRKLFRRGSNEKQPVINMYCVVVIPDGDAEQSKMLDQLT